MTPATRSCKLGHDIVENLLGLPYGASPASFRGMFSVPEPQGSWLNGGLLVSILSADVYSHSLRVTRPITVRNLALGTLAKLFR